MLHGARDTQEDEVGWIEAGTLDPQGEHPVAVVADGMGGHAAGDEASRIAVREFLEAYGKQGAASERLGRALDCANRALREATDQDAAFTGMGTTLLAVAVTAEGLHWISVGDSPLYLYRDGLLERLNADHSMRPVIAKIREEDPALAAEYNPNELRSVLMGSPIPKIDVSGQPRPLAPGDLVLAATDGIESLEDDEILETISEHRGADPAGICEALLRAVEAKQHPRQDNTTIALLELHRSAGDAETRAPEEDGVWQPVLTEFVPVEEKSEGPLETEAAAPAVGPEAEEFPAGSTTPTGESEAAAEVVSVSGQETENDGNDQSGAA